MSMIKCESCRKGFNGRNGNGYSPCSCKHNKEPRPEYIPPPPLVDLSNYHAESEPEARDSNIFIVASFMFFLGLIVGHFI